MATKRSKSVAELPRWRISFIKGTPAAELGMVEAPNVEAAIKAAIEKFNITDRWRQERLVARRIA
jgi:hypothetical protein